MRIAIPVHESRISPVFDTASHLLLVDAGGGREMGRLTTPLTGSSQGQRVERLAELGVWVLICGGISAPLARLIEAIGIRVIPWTAGPVEYVLQAYLAGRLSGNRFLMPGCCRRRGRFGWGRAGRGGGPRWAPFAQGVGRRGFQSRAQAGERQGANGRGDTKEVE